VRPTTNIRLTITRLLYTRACERSAKRSGSGRKSGGAERVLQKTTERSGNGAGSRGYRNKLELKVMFISNFPCLFHIIHLHKSA